MWSAFTKADNTVDRCFDNLLHKVHVDSMIFQDTDECCSKTGRESFACDAKATDEEGETKVLEKNLYKACGVHTLKAHSFF